MHWQYDLLIMNERSILPTKTCAFIYWFIPGRCPHQTPEATSHIWPKVLHLVVIQYWSGISRRVFEKPQLPIMYNMRMHCAYPAAQGAIDATSQVHAVNTKGDQFSGTKRSHDKHPYLSSLYRLSRLIPRLRARHCYSSGIHWHHKYLEFSCWSGILLLHTAKSCPYASVGIWHSIFWMSLSNLNYFKSFYLVCPFKTQQAPVK